MRTVSRKPSKIASSQRSKVGANLQQPTGSLAQRPGRSIDSRKMSASSVKYPLLESSESPPDLRRLPATRLVELAGELRQFLIHSVSTRGGHFAAMEQPALLVDDVRAFFRALR